MSNYPPGVTGNEYEIAGPDAEWYDDSWICKNQIQEVQLPLDVFKKIEYFLSSYTDEVRYEIISKNLASHLARLRNEIINATKGEPTIISYTCNNIGAEKQSYRGEIWWQCDQCGEEYQDWIDDRD